MGKPSALPFDKLRTRPERSRGASSVDRLPAAPTPEQLLLLKDIPHVFQKPDFCGEACAEMWFRKIGAKLTQDDVFNVSGVDPLPGRGCYTAELTRALKQMGFKIGDVWFKIPANRADEELLALWNALHADLLRGIPFM